MPTSLHRDLRLLPLVVLAASLLPICAAQTPIMALGDSITHGGQGYASYRYPLWFELEGAGYAVDFVGGRTEIFGGGVPNPALYPDYATSFDRDHEGYWGWRTDEIAGIAVAVTTAAQPDIVLVHLGTNDIGQMGAAGVTNADTNLRLIIERIRSVRPSVTILLAQVIPIGPGSSYFANAGQVGPLNATIATVAADLDTAGSPIIVVDQNNGYDVGTMMQSDGLHPNAAGETQMATTWAVALATLLTPGNTPPNVSIVTPVNGATFGSPADIVVAADASDPNGSVNEVRFYEGANLLATDTTAPFGFDWLDVPVGNYTLTAVAIDDQGLSRTSAPVSISVLPFIDGVPVVISNPSFETPALPDGALAPGPGTVGDWLFAGTANTFVGIFDPPAGSYPDAAGDGPPSGADGANVAYLFNDGGPAEAVSASQVLAEPLRADMEYLLTVAIGRFLPDQPYSFSTYGGYRVELLAGSTVIASDSDTIQPVTGSFSDASATVIANSVDPLLLGQALTINLTISSTEEDRSTHFDLVRLIRRSLLPGDGDDDGDVDLEDVTQFLDCMAGPDATPDPAPPTTAQACTTKHDLDADGDADLADMVTWQRGFTGSL